MSEKLKKETENLEKLKKINTELSISKSASESAMSDLNDKLAALVEDRNLLEHEMAKLQSQLQLERNQRNETSVRVHEVEARLQVPILLISSLAENLKFWPKFHTSKSDNLNLSRLYMTILFDNRY
jgi:chromosome segregation ATPase